MESAAFSIISSYPSSSSPKFHSFTNLFASVTLKFPLHKFPLVSTSHTIKRAAPFPLRAALESLTLEDNVEESEENIEKSQNTDKRRKLFVFNLPWSFSVVDIKNLFAECGAVEDVEIIKQKDGKNRGYAFVTMASGEEAQAAVQKFDSFEVAGRIITVQFAKRFKKPRPAVAADSPEGETRHKIYVSNLAWKVRSNNLRELFSSNSNPVSARVVFDGPSGRSTGYGFVSFATKEEAESAISYFEGKELLGRPIRLKFSEKNNYASEAKEEEPSDQQTAES